MNFRNATIGIWIALGLLGGVAGAAAQEDDIVLVAGTVDCRVQLRPVETAICSTPVLAAMDLQMITLFNALNLLVKPEVGAQMAANQQVFQRTREACGSDANCIGEIIATRVVELDGILRDIASRGPY